MGIKPIDRQRMISEYLDAYKAANRGPAPRVLFRDGYFLVGYPVVKFRKSGFRQLTTALRGRAAPALYRGYRNING